MAKVLKILGRIVGISFEWVLLILILFAFAIPSFARAVHFALLL